MNQAVKSANQAAENAEIKAGEAESAASNANNVASAAGGAANSANQAAENANSKAQMASTAAGSANTAAENARNAASSADTAAEQISQKANNGDFTGTVTIGTVTTGAPGTSASVENVGTAKDAILNMTIPKGETGEIENIDTVQVDFEQAGTRTNIQSGETFETILGKIKKWLSDLKALAFTADYKDILNAPDPTAVKGNAESTYRTGDVNLTPANIGAVATSKIVASTNITEPGFVMDGKTASEAFAELNRKLPISGQETLIAEWNDIVFDKPFDMAPTVLVTFVTSTLAATNPVMAKISNITTTGFKACLVRPAGTYAPGTINWVAFPKL